MSYVSDLVLLGATGSIGLNTVKVCLENSIDIKAIAFGSNIEEAKRIIKLVKPKCVCTSNDKVYECLKKCYSDIEIVYGIEGIERVLEYSLNVVNAISGVSGLVPSVKAIERCKNLYLANKESLVVAGDILIKMAEKNNVNIVPIDSEHNAIYRLINNKSVKNIIITASGGALRNRSREELFDVDVQSALNHPNWEMGKKITIDSATMVNKGLEVIEAHYLFNIDYDRIKTIIHPESIIHSMVEYKDNSVSAVMYNPSMVIPIQNAILGDYETTDVKQLDFSSIGALHFYDMDYERFPMIKLAYEVGRLDGLFRTVYNASNEAAVDLFLKGKISFLEIEEIIKKQIEDFKNSPFREKEYNIDNIIQIDLYIKMKVNDEVNK